MAYLLCIEGILHLSAAPTEGGSSEACTATTLTASRHDEVEIQGQAGGSVVVTVEATGVEPTEGGTQSAHFMVFEMKKDRQGGRTDI